MYNYEEDFFNIDYIKSKLKSDDSCESFYNNLYYISQKLQEIINSKNIENNIYDYLQVIINQNYLYSNAKFCKNCSRICDRNGKEENSKIQRHRAISILLRLVEISIANNYILKKDVQKKYFLLSFVRFKTKIA